MTTEVPEMLNEGMIVSMKKVWKTRTTFSPMGMDVPRCLEAPGKRETLREVLAELEDETGEQEDGRAALDGLYEMLQLVTAHEEEREKDDDGHTREQGYEVLLLHASPHAMKAYICILGQEG